MANSFVTAAEFASIAGISRQAAWKACVVGSWRGYALEVCTVNGRGGASGKSHLIKVSSLPPYLQERLKALQTPAEGRSVGLPASASAREHCWWDDVLAPAIAHPPRSAERAAVLKELDGTVTRDWMGRAVTLQLRTLQRQARRIDDGMRSGRHRRADRGQKRVFVSRKWDHAVPFDDAVKAKVAEDLKREIGSLFKSGASWGHTQLLAGKFLADTTRSHGFRPRDAAALEAVCAIPKPMISAELHYRKVDQFKRNRKAYEDTKPRIRRGYKDMRPMELVVGDVHPADIHLKRADGTLATAKLIAFMDVATQRIWCSLIQFEGRGGVRNIDVIEVFAAMCADPAWGVPEALYIDNGKEYGFADYLDDAMNLVLPGFHGPQRLTHVHRARPYNAPGKGWIERWFGDFETRFLSTLDGWISGDRMNKRQGAVGKTVAPFGSFEDFAPVLYGLLKAYHHIPHSKDAGLAGVSPEAKFKEHVNAGWAATVMSPDEVRAACAKTVERALTQGAFSLKGRVWTCPELVRHLGDRILVKEPAYHTPAELLVLDLKGERIGVATPDVEYHPLDTRGAKTASDRQREHRKAVRDLDRSVPDTDVAARLIAFGEAQPDTVPNEPVGTISYDPERRPAKIVMPKQGKRKNDRAEEDARIEEQLAFLKRIAG